MNHPLDAVIAARTGFSSMADMLASHPNYRPSLDMRESWARDVADAYDAEQAKAGDPRRAYRYAIAEGEKIAAAEPAPAPLVLTKAHKLRAARDAVAKEREECGRALKKAYPDLSWHRSRGQILWAVDGNNDRLNGSGWEAWNGTWKQLQALADEYPSAKAIWAEVGMNAAESLQAMERGDYECEMSDALVWKAPE